MSELDTGTEELAADLTDGLLTLTLNRPDARNALSDDLRHGLYRMIGEIPGRDDIRALLLTGAGGAFCAGGDVKGMGASYRQTMTSDDAVEELRRRQRSLTGAIAALRIPTVAALPGPAAGAGLALALACDLRVAAESAFVATSYVRIALPGDYGINWLLTRTVGPAKARELMLLSERVDAATCAQLGLVNRVAPDSDLMEVATALARKLADGPRHAIAAIKDNLDRAPFQDFGDYLDEEAEVLVRTGQHPDHDEARRAFAEKRPPRFGN